MSLTIGTQAPDFTLPDEQGENHSLREYLGKWVLLYFYPKDDTPGCTTEACTIRDNYSLFTKAGIVVLGVSTDTVKSHSKFVTKYKLPFTLLADEQKQVVALYTVWQQKKFMGRQFMGTLRNSYLIDPQGTIAKVYEGVKPADHAQEVLSDVATLSSTIK